MESDDGLEVHQHGDVMLQVNSVGLMAPPVVPCHRSFGPSFPVLLGPTARMKGT